MMVVFSSCPAFKTMLVKVSQACPLAEMSLTTRSLPVILLFNALSSLCRAFSPLKASILTSHLSLLLNLNFVSLRRLQCGLAGCRGPSPVSFSEEDVSPPIRNYSCSLCSVFWLFLCPHSLSPLQHISLFIRLFPVVFLWEKESICI